MLKETIRNLKIRKQIKLENKYYSSVTFYVLSTLLCSLKKLAHAIFTAPYDKDAVTAI